MFLLKKVTYKDILNISELRLKQGEITSIIGESGSGKTTLLRLLNKLISCDSGSICYKDRNLRDIDAIELRRKVVMLPQTPVIFPESIKDNLLIGLKFAEKETVSDDRLKDILNMVHLNKELSSQSDTLSGGEKQRLSLARVILLDPDVFLLDEPSSALDEETEDSIIKQLAQYTKTSNKTLIMVIHSKKTAQTYSDNIIEINQGNIRTVQEVK
ncbi:ABC transporter ATP-binding protein [Streptococcus phocae]|uniref:ABC transporter ATP-binding protein n=1 Tax=Streptococcus phocae TaxID=119224 RepID=A0A0P6S4Z7_9STRE|nr:ATP-binding cassette domain-containing protein [Streptococcus phocae]KPJ22241.1 ABC transporter ATP-binding protein [Streptococcus phocae]